MERFRIAPGPCRGPIRDTRFSDPAWQENSLASFAARTYLINAEFMKRIGCQRGRRSQDEGTGTVCSVPVDRCAAPSNFLAFNPKVQKRLLETKGSSLTYGLQNLLEDVAKGKISQTDESAFEIGRNVATSERNGRFRERPDPIDPVQAIDAQGAGPAVPDRAALHQQVLHPGSATGDTLRRFCVERGTRCL